jgi:hypothetical protein
MLASWRLSYRRGDFGVLTSSRRNVLAAGARLAASDGDISPGPVGAGARAAKDVDISAAADGTLDVGQGEVLDGNAVGGGAGGGAVLVVLLNDDTVLGDAAEGDAGVGDVLDSAGSIVHGLDADTVLGVADGGVGDVDAGHGVVRAATD